MQSRIAPQSVVIVLVRVIRQDAVDPHPDHLQKRVVHLNRGADIRERVGEPASEPDLLIELTKRQKSRVRRQLPGCGLNHDGLGTEKIEGNLEDRLLIHYMPPCAALR
ncbi:MAG TPA: hypothetical protein VNH11_24560 [Pirellulales bacterium]|nr:hypothetical protein [Pirellulales bacterium]